MIPNRRYTPYHRSILPDTQQRVYTIIREALIESELTVTIDEPDLVFGDIDVYNRIVTGILHDSPMMFWIGTHRQYEYDGKRMTIRLEGNELFEDRSPIIDRIEGKIRPLVIHARQLKSEYDVSLYIHDYLEESTTYEDTGVESHCIVGPLLKGEGVCEGISHSYNLLMNACGIRCTTIHGHMNGSDENHAWNISIIDGKPYHTDVTNSNGVHRYLNCDDSMMALTHRFNRYTICDSRESNHYSRNDTYFETSKGFHDVLDTLPLCKLRDYEFFIEEGSSVDDIMAMLSDRRFGHVRVTSSNDGRGFRIRGSVI